TKSRKETRRGCMSSPRGSLPRCPLVVALRRLTRGRAVLCFQNTRSRRKLGTFGVERRHFLVKGHGLGRGATGSCIGGTRFQRPPWVPRGRLRSPDSGGGRRRLDAAQRGRKAW